MSAKEPSKNLQATEAISSDLRGLVESCERILQTHICFHDYTGRVLSLLGLKYKHHFSTFCAKVKKSGRQAVNRCMDCDMQLVAKQLSTFGKPFFKICHGQVGEAVIPLVYNGSLGGAYFIGPFRWGSDSEYPDSFLVQTTPAKKRDLFKKHRAELREVSQSDIDDIIRFGAMLAQHTVAAIESVERSETQQAQGYKERIESYLNEHLADTITRTELAKFLCLSESRISQLLRGIFKKTLPQLVTTLRVEYAKQLLKNTSLTIDTVARHAGVEDSLYFYRIFRKETGMTPREFRQMSPAGELSTSV